MHMFLAEDCVLSSKQKLDESEIVDIANIVFNDAVKMALDNSIKCNSSISGILRVKCIK